MTETQCNKKLPSQTKPNISIQGLYFLKNGEQKDGYQIPSSNNLLEAKRSQKFATLQPTEFSRVFNAKSKGV